MINADMFKREFIGHNTDNQIMSALEMAEYLQIGKNRAYDLLRHGIVHGFRIGNTWRVSKEAIDLYIREQSGLSI